MSFSSTAETDAIIELLFDPNEVPIFIDGTAALDDFVRDPNEFLRRASQRFGFNLQTGDLKLTIPELADKIRNHQKQA